jgi:1-phosphofructokinase
MILTLTPNPAVDETIEMDEPLAADAVQSTREMQFTPGGDGINVSEFVHALGGETMATGVTGGFTGYFIEQDLSGLDIPTDFCSVDSAPTRINTTILAPPPEELQTTRVGDDEAVERQQFQLQQPGPEVDEECVDRLVETVREHDPDILNIGGSLPRGMGPADIDRLAAAGDWDTALNVHGEVLGDLEESYECCRLNRAGIEAATGVTIDSIDDCKDAALALQAEGFERVVASMADDGAVLVTPEQALYAPSLNVDVADTVAAGDALLAGILWGYEQGWDDRRALKAGVATAGAVVGVTGTSIDHIDPEPAMAGLSVWQLDHDRET